MIKTWSNRWCLKRARKMIREDLSLLKYNNNIDKLSNYIELLKVYKQLTPKQQIERKIICKAICILYSKIDNLITYLYKNGTYSRDSNSN